MHSRQAGNMGAYSAVVGGALFDHFGPWASGIAGLSLMTIGYSLST
jgi:hypothetical protein